MAFRKIEIPGGTTTYEDAPRVRVIGEPDSDVMLVITYQARPVGEPGAPLGEITFKTVLEYRLRSQDFAYQEYPEHARDFAFGLIEVLDSRYVETMASLGMYRLHEGERFGGTIPESAVRHFRIGFDNYGTFDVIALDVSVREVAA